MTRGQYNAYRGWQMPTDENPDEEGYIVEYLDGGKPNDSRHENYISWSPKDVFERSYSKIAADPIFGEDSNRILALQRVIMDLENQWRRVGFLNGGERLRPQQKPSRELALCLTKIQEAQMWVKSELDQLQRADMPQSNG